MKETQLAHSAHSGRRAIWLIALLCAVFSFAVGASDAYATGDNTSFICKNGITLSLEEVKSQIAAGNIRISISVTTGVSSRATVVNDTTCGFPASFISWKMYDQKLSTQTRFDSENKTVPAKSTTVFDVSLPGCMAQVDLFYGNGFTTLHDDNREGQYLLAFRFDKNNSSGYANASGQFCTKPLALTCSASPSSLNVGGTATFTANPTGGNGTYTYSWTGTDGLSGTAKTVSKSYATAGTKTATVTAVSGAETKIANCSVSVVVPNITASCTAVPGVILVNGTVSYTAQATGGNGIYTYSWTGTDGLSGTTQSVSKTYATAGAKDAAVTISSGGKTVTVHCGAQVNAPVPELNATCSASKSPINTNESVTYTANPTGGTGTYAYSWTGTDGLSGTAKTVSKSYATEGSKTATVTVTSGTKTKTVSCGTQVQTPPPALNVSCAASPSKVDVGGTVTYTANPTGGTGSYTYSWTGTDSLVGTSKTVSKSYSTAGAKTATVTVVSGGVTKTASCSSTVEQDPALGLTCTASKSVLDVNESVTYTANPTGGNGTYTYSWTGTDGLSGTAKTVSKSYSTEGSKAATVTATSNGQTKTASCSVTVDEDDVPLGGSCTPNKQNIKINENVVFTAQGTGGTGFYTYQWGGGGSGIFFDSAWNQTGGTLSGRFNTPGTKNVQVRINSGNDHIFRTCTVVVEEDDLDASCSGSPSTIEEGDTATWSATATGGNGSYTYEWEGTDNLDGTGRTISKRYTSEGTKTATLRVTSNGRSITRSCSIRVEEEDADDLEVSCRANPRRAEVDERVTWTASVSGGNSPYEYEWDGDDRLSGDDRTITHRYDDEGEYDAEVEVTDEDGNRDTARCSVDVEEEDDDNDVAVYTDPGDTTTASAVYLSQVPYTGAAENWKISLYVLGFLLWSGAVSYYIMKRKYGIEHPIAFAAEKVGLATEDLSHKIAELRILDKMRSDRDERFKKLWNRVNDK